MGNDLACDSSIGLGDVDAVSSQLLVLGLRDFFHNGDELPQHLVRRSGDWVRMGFRYDQRVAFDDRADVHETQYILVLVDLHGRQVSGDDPAEYAVVAHFC